MYFLKNSEDLSFEIDRIRIIDFYLSSPTALRAFKFPADLRTKRKIFSDKVNDYNDIPNQRSLFFEMWRIQQAVFDMLVSIGFIDRSKLKEGSIYLLRDNVTDELAKLLEAGSSIDEDIKDFAINDLAKIPLLGVNGLKDRSGLMDHRYDLV
jgi:hypothetical protein